MSSGRTVTAALVAGFTLGARGEPSWILLRYRPPAGDLSRIEMEASTRYRAHVISGPTTTGNRVFATVAVAADSAGIARLRVHIDSNFAISDNTVTAFRWGGPSDSWLDLVLDDRRRLLPLGIAMADSALANSLPALLFMSLFPFPVESVGRGGSWREDLQYHLPNFRLDQGLVDATVAMKLKDVTVDGTDTILVLGITLHGKGRMLPAAQQETPFSISVSLRGEERYALRRGVTTVLDLRGTFAMEPGLVGGLHMPPLENELRISRRLLVNQ